VHSLGLRGALEHGAKQVHLPLPRLPVQQERQGVSLNIFIDVMACAIYCFLSRSRMSIREWCRMVCHVTTVYSFDPFHFCVGHPINKYINFSPFVLRSCPQQQ